MSELAVPSRVLHYRMRGAPDEIVWYIGDGELEDLWEMTDYIESAQKEKEAKNAHYKCKSTLHILY